jgi:hypothetical protein
MIEYGTRKVIVRTAIEYLFYIAGPGNSRPQKGNNFTDKKLFARMKVAHKSVQVADIQG